MHIMCRLKRHRYRWVPTHDMEDAYASEVCTRCNKNKDNRRMLDWSMAVEFCNDMNAIRDSKPEVKHPGLELFQAILGLFLFFQNVGNTARSIAKGQYWSLWIFVPLMLYWLYDYKRHLDRATKGCPFEPVEEEEMPKIVSADEFYEMVYTKPRRLEFLRRWYYALHQRRQNADRL